MGVIRAPYGCANLARISSPAMRACNNSASRRRVSPAASRVASSRVAASGGRWRAPARHRRRRTRGPLPLRTVRPPQHLGGRRNRVAGQGTIRPRDNRYVLQRVDDVDQVAEAKAIVAPHPLSISRPIGGPAGGSDRSWGVNWRPLRRGRWARRGQWGCHGHHARPAPRHPRHRNGSGSKDLRACLPARPAATFAALSLTCGFYGGGWS